MFGGLTFAVLVGRAIGLVIGFTIHEFAHAWSAFRLGDSTAYFQGRLTLDPRAHIEPIGIILALLVGFGWAKPVPFNPSAFYPHEKRGTMLVALAGPVSNLILAIIFGLGLRLALATLDKPFANAGYALFLSPEIPGLVRFGLQTLHTIVLFNLVLMLFNLIPLSPLDGWKIMLGLLPDRESFQVAQYERESTFGLMLLLMIGVISPALNILGLIFGPMFDLFFNLVVF